ncbi:hypothetical protein EVAR_6073_1 [Eumeta japonica]|uniref:Uncharacterized protein n=1 Tax=Eumeta variegata TaxID=151549 RepID=A0A4C1TH48_EUMVA|nr:hypothetical protein EVAR_6073_1 [Eumeta japonica]
MESGFSKANSNNLPRVDAVMLGPHELHMGTTVSYVQLKRDSKCCTVKCKYVRNTKFMLNYMDAHWLLMRKTKLSSVQCEDCVASQGGCKRDSFLMWLHRRRRNHHAHQWSATGRNPNSPESK